MRKIVLPILVLLIAFSFGCKKKSSLDPSSDQTSGFVDQLIPSPPEDILSRVEEGKEGEHLPLPDSDFASVQGDPSSAASADLDPEKEVSESENSKKNPSIQTMAQQIQLMKKGEWFVDLHSSSLSKAEIVVDQEMSSGKSGLGDQKEIQLKDGSKTIQKLVGSPAFIRSDDHFSFRKRFERVIPHDYRVGQLADLKSSIYRESRVIKNLIDFFTLFAEEKKIEEKYLYKESKELIVNSLNYYIQSGALPDTLFRIGKIHSKSGSVVRVNMRFYYNDSCADGEVILEEVVDKSGEKNWLISDIQVDFMKLLEKYKGFSEPYLPSSFQYFDWE